MKSFLRNLPVPAEFCLVILIAFGLPMYMVALHLMAATLTSYRGAWLHEFMCIFILQPRGLTNRCSNRHRAFSVDQQMNLIAIIPSESQPPWLWLSLVVRR